MKPSPQAIQFLKDNKLKEKQIVSWNPLDLPGCVCEALIKAELFKSEQEKRPPNPVVCPASKGLQRFDVICNKCKDTLAYFYGQFPSLEGQYYDLHYVSWYNKAKWHGCLGHNRNPYTLKVNFECACGNSEINEKRFVKGSDVLYDTPRYTSYTIKANANNK